MLGLWVLAVLGLRYAQRHLDEARFQSRDIDKRIFLPEKKRTKALSMGYHTAMADLFWIRTLLIYSDLIGQCGKQESIWLRSMLRSITYLDPTWRTPYFYGGSMLAVCMDIEGSDEIFEAGYERIDKDAFFAFSISANASMHHKDKEKALLWMQRAADSPTAAPWYASAVANLIRKGEGREASIQYLQEKLKHIQDPELREHTQEQLRKLIHEVYVEEIEKQQILVEAHLGRSIDSPAELGIPYPDPFAVRGGMWVIGEDGKVRSSVMEEHQKKVLQKEELELLYWHAR